MKLSNLIKSTVALAAGACILTGCSDDKPTSSLAGNISSSDVTTAAGDVAPAGATAAAVAASMAATFPTGIKLTFEAGSSDVEASDVNGTYQVTNVGSATVLTDSSTNAFTFASTGVPIGNSLLLNNLTTTDGATSGFMILTFNTTNQGTFLITVQEGSSRTNSGSATGSFSN